MSSDSSFRIGYALLEKKQRSFLQPSLLRLAQSHGIDLIPIDTSSALSQQGPFDAILHKLSPSSSWNQELADFSSSHPEVVVIDPPHAIQRLHNRISMLEVVADLPVSEEHNTVGTPKQCVLDGERSTNLTNLDALTRLNFPMIAKPLVADGSAKSHAMSLVFNAESLAKLQPPLVLQEFINHGGLIFKVYVVDEYVQCVRRRSIPDVDEGQLENSGGPVSFSQISNTALNADIDVPEVELPPTNFILSIASGLRKALGLRLFNFDIIRDVKAGNRYYIIDINYFPGYAKMPDYETVLIDFFLRLADKKTSP